MTNDKINELLAVEVMGWTLTHENMWLDKYGEQTYSYCSDWSRKSVSNCISSYKPTEDMNQADSLMEYCEDNDHWGFLVTSSEANKDGERVYVEIVQDQTPIFEGYFKGRNKALAICKAILKAKGIEV